MEICANNPENTNKKYALLHTIDHLDDSGKLPANKSWLNIWFFYSTYVWKADPLKTR